jgi:hypothetical protein
MTCSRRIARLIPLLAVFAGSSWAQSPPAGGAAPGPLDAIRGKATLDDADRAALRSWAEERIKQITSGDAGAALAVQQLRAEHGVANASPAYRDAVTAVYIELIRPQVHSASLTAAGQLVALLGSLNEATTYPVLIEALKDERIGVRTAAAAALRGLRVKLALPGGNYFAETMVALKDAAQKETSSVALQIMYQAMNYPEVVPSPPDPKLVLTSLLDVLEARAARYEAGDVRAEAADTPGLKALSGLVRNMSDADRNRCLVAVGPIFRRMVVRYKSELHKLSDKAGPLAQLRNDAEQLIEQCEALLTQLLSVSKSPEVGPKMRKGEIDYMTIEFNKWAELIKKQANKDFSISAGESAP